MNMKVSQGRKWLIHHSSELFHFLPGYTRKVDLGYAIALLQRRNDVVIAPSTRPNRRITSYGNRNGWPGVQKLPCGRISEAANLQVQMPG
jgi:hypothetical protein